MTQSIIGRSIIRVKTSGTALFEVRQRRIARKFMRKNVRVRIIARRLNLLPLPAM